MLHQKILVVLTLLGLIFSLAGCKKKAEENQPIPSTPVVEPGPSNFSETITLDNVDPLEAPLLIQEALFKKEAYEYETEGATVAKVIIKYTQKIKAIVYKKGNKAYLYNESPYF